jgi:thiol:disulfide interchange protein
MPIARGLVAASLFLVSVLAQEPAPSPVPVPTTPVGGAPAAAPPKPAKAKVYDEAADAKAVVAAAIARAKQENQRVLIQWGANWCGWCVWLAGTMEKDAAVRRTLSYEYQVVHVDVGRFDKHMDLAKSLGAEFQSIPFLTVLDGDGKPLAQQPTEPFETKVDGKDGHDGKKLNGWLVSLQAPPRDAEVVLAAARLQAKEQQKRVFLHFGAPWCIWCHRLEAWLARPEIAAVVGKEFVDCKVDIDRMTGGKAVHEHWLAQAGQKGDGIPWFAFVDPDGTLLAHSTGPKGNAGFPFEPVEIDHFATMLKAVQKHLTAAEVEALAASLHANREAAKAAQGAGR